MDRISKNFALAKGAVPVKIDQVKAYFEEKFGSDGEIFCFHSPGRVNLIGEHTDYNGGYVLPCALSLGTYGIIRIRQDRQIRLASTNFSIEVSCSLDEIAYNPAHDWTNYVKGIVVEFQERNLALQGFDMLLSGNIPNGAGLSSSASVELLTATALNDLFACGLDPVTLVKLSQHAENSYVGMNCGIMDQYAVGMGKKDYAVFLNCGKILHEYVPLKLSDCRIVIANTNKRRSLTDSKYNERRAQCEEAVQYLNQRLNISCLSDLTVAEFEENKLLIPDETVLRRARHIVYENDRVLKAVACLRDENLTEFGRLMKQSHDSLRDDYEVTGQELDALAEEAWTFTGTVGSRMTGAGFGGCTVSLVKADKIDEFCELVGKKYKERTGLQADFYIAETGNGSGRIG